MIIDFRGGNGGGGGSSTNIIPLEATENKIYEAPEGSAYSPVTVDVKPKLQRKWAYFNGEVLPDQGYDGLSEVDVNVYIPSNVIDLSGTGWETEPIFPVNIPGSLGWNLESQIGYTKKVFSKWDPSRTSAEKLYYEDTNLVYAPKIDTAQVTNMSYCFYSCSSLTTIPQLNTAQVTNMGSCFSGCSSLTSIPALDTAQVTNMDNCFSYCKSLTSIPELNTAQVTDMDNCFSYCKSLTSIPELNTAQVTDMYNCFYSCRSLTTIPALDTSKVTSMSSCFDSCSSLTSIPKLNIGKVKWMVECFSGCASLTSVEFEGGVAPGCNCSNMFQDVTTTGTFYYHVPGDYSPVLAQLPETWTAVPIGEVSFRIRVLKDAKWLTEDQNLVMGGKTLTYEGKGIYSTTLTFTKEGPNPSTDLLLDGVKVGTAKTITDEQIFEAGDNSSLETSKVGADILTLVPEGGNPDGWTYDEQVKGVKSNTESWETTLKLSIPGPFSMTWGQDCSMPELNFGELLNGAGTEIVSFKDKRTGPDGQEVFEGSTDDGIVQAVYGKVRGISMEGLDAFWIKSIRWISYPPYPEV